MRHFNSVKHPQQQAPLSTPQAGFWGCQLLPAAQTCLTIPGQDMVGAVYLGAGREGAEEGPSSREALCFGLASEEKAGPGKVQRKEAT